MTASKRWLRWDRTSISPSPSALADVSHRQTATAAIVETMRFIVLQAPLDSRQPPSEISCCGLIYAYKPFYTRSFIESATVRYKSSTAYRVASSGAELARPQRPGRQQPPRHLTPDAPGSGFRQWPAR